MSMTFWGVTAILLASVGILAVMLLGLVRHLKLLSGSLKAFQSDIQPVLEAIQTDGQRAQERLASVPSDRAGLLARVGSMPKGAGGSDTTEAATQA